MAKIPTFQQIETLVKNARAGDVSALETLSDLNNKFAKRANQRMTEIERAKGISHTDAYDRAQYYLENVADTATRNKQGNMRFSQSKKLDINEIEENLDKVTQFLRDDTSKVSAVKYRRAEESFETLSEHGFIDDLSASNKKKFFRFLKTDAWEDIKKHIGSGFIKDASDAISRGVRVGDLVNLYNDYKSRNDVDIFDLTDAWTSGKRKL